MAPLAAVSRRSVQGGVQLPHNLAQDLSQKSAASKSVAHSYSVIPRQPLSVLSSVSSSSCGDPLVADASAHFTGPEPRISSLHDRFERIKEIGDGSFGSVVRACERRPPGSQRSSRSSTYFAVKIIKKPFGSLRDCNELREVIFLRTLPPHPNLVPALDIFLDRSTRQLHIVMEFMDCNLYQLMKSRDGQLFSADTVRGILRQIMTGLRHIHRHSFFHRDIKPENILVSSAPADKMPPGYDSRRYSTALVTPPSTPLSYTIKLADFGLAREIGAGSSYTTYVSTRWYRAPEVLFHARSYSAPVDIWAVGVMAAEIATLKPLFPGSNEVDQVYRICAVRGSPDGQHNNLSRPTRTSIISRHILSPSATTPADGGEWLAGVEMANKVGVKLYRLSPRSLSDVIGSNFPKDFYDFIDWCLKWDPALRPSSNQALEHSYLSGAPPSSHSSRLSNRRTVDNLANVAQSASSRTSWFKRTLGVASIPSGSESKNAPTDRAGGIDKIERKVSDAKDKPSRRTTWASSFASASPAVSHPVPSASTITENTDHSFLAHQDPSAVHPNHSVQANPHSRLHRLEAERALNGHVSTDPSEPAVSSPHINSPAQSQAREGFFSHLRKRARRMSGRPSLPLSPESDINSNGGVAAGGVSVNCAPWNLGAARHSVIGGDTQPDGFYHPDHGRATRPSVDSHVVADTPPKPKQLHRLSASSLLLRRLSHRHPAPAPSAAHSQAQQSQESSGHSPLPSYEPQTRTHRRPFGMSSLSGSTVAPPIEILESPIENGSAMNPTQTYTVQSPGMEQIHSRALQPIHPNTVSITDNKAAISVQAHEVSGPKSTWSSGVASALHSLALHPPSDSVRYSLPVEPHAQPSMIIPPSMFGTASVETGRAGHHQPMRILPAVSNPDKPVGHLPPVAMVPTLDYVPPSNDQGIFSGSVWNSHQ